ncbi:hypothetical protein NMY22_g7379 [Coprinellus aureogranulatus]|nr:hypothetical protein NMY22_g7379 [Coprinellus aureogranulatus]
MSDSILEDSWYFLQRQRIDVSIGHLTASPSVDNVYDSTLKVPPPVRIVLKSCSPLWAVALAATYIYHCITTAEEEVEHIWSRRISLGSILYLLPRYLPIINYAVAFPNAWKEPGGHYGLKTCTLLHILYWGTYNLAISRIYRCLPAVLTLCIYALSGGGKLSGILLSMVYIGFAASILGIYVMKVVTGSYDAAFDSLFSALGYVCLREPRDLGSSNKTGVATGVLWLSWKVGRYVYNCTFRNRSSVSETEPLFDSLNPEGRECLLPSDVRSISVLSFSSGLYKNCFQYLFLAPVLSTALLLNLRKAESPTTQAVVSKLVFGGDTQSGGSRDEFGSSLAQDEEQMPPGDGNNTSNDIEKSITTEESHTAPTVPYRSSHA